MKGSKGLSGSIDVQTTETKDCNKSCKNKRGGNSIAKFDTTMTNAT